VEECQVTEVCIEQLVVTRGRRRLLDNVTLLIKPGERVIIVGPNGAGKTTLLRAILGLVPAEQGRILLDGVPTESLSPLSRSAKVAWLAQQALVEEPITCLELAQSARYRFRETSSAARRAAHQVLERVGMRHLAQRLVTQLSGGERQRVALAALLAQQAPLLLADEPANHLDPAQQVWAWTMLGQVALDGSLVVVTHSINLISLLGDTSGTRVVGLKHGTVIFDVNYDDASLPRHLQSLYDVAICVHLNGPDRVIIPTGQLEKQE
jgi:iron complex transport system ATP-binding protein